MTRPTFNADPQGISRIWVITWNAAEGTFGVAYERVDGNPECVLVGSRADAQAIVDEIDRQRQVARGENVIDLAVAAEHNRRG